MYIWTEKGLFLLKHFKNTCNCCVHKKVVPYFKSGHKINIGLFLVKSNILYVT